MGDQILLLVCLLKESLGRCMGSLDKLRRDAMVLDVEKAVIFSGSSHLRGNGFPGSGTIIDGAKIDDWDFLFSRRPGWCSRHSTELRSVKSEQLNLSVSVSGSHSGVRGSCIETMRVPQLFISTRILIYQVKCNGDLREMQAGSS